MELDEVTEIVARQAVAMIVGRAGDGTDCWEDFPDIGQHDWERICSRISQLVNELRPDADLYWKAYRLLADRAEK